PEIGVAALVGRSLARERALGREVAAERRHRVERVEAVPDGCVRRGTLRRQDAAAMQVIRGGACAAQGPLLLIAPAAADEYPAFRGLMRTSAPHDVEAYGSLTLHAVIDPLQPVV